MVRASNGSLSTSSRERERRGDTQTMYVAVFLFSLDFPEGTRGLYLFCIMYWKGKKGKRIINQS